MLLYNQVARLLPWNAVVELEGSRAGERATKAGSHSPWKHRQNSALEPSNSTEMSFEALKYQNDQSSSGLLVHIRRFGAPFQL